MEMKIIDELLEDKQQIVTYKYLTKELNIHPNKAKQLLINYISKITNNKKYSITVAMGGILNENDEFCVVLAYDDHVETMRRRFKKIDFEHIFSIQPISSRLSDINNALYLADSLPNLYVNLPSSIKKREREKISINDQNVKMEIDINLPIIEKTNLKPNAILNCHDEIKLYETQEKKTDLNFKNNKDNNNPKLKEMEKKVNSDFFNKFKKNKSNNIKTNFENKTVTKNENANMGLDSPKNVKEDTIKMDVELPKNVQGNSNNENNFKKKNNSIKKKTDLNKNKNKNSQKIKRKRIKTFDSSDEEVDSEEEDKKKSENIIDVEDEADFIQPTPPRPTLRDHRKKEKQITTSTFIDEDGFVCTTKEVKIVETESDEPSESFENTEIKELNIESINNINKLLGSDSAVVKVNKQNNKNKQFKNNSNQGMKQSSLTSFFKKK